MTLLNGRLSNMIKKKCMSCNNLAYASKINIPAMCDTCVEKNIQIMNNKESVGK
jgi:hypothetical protein